MSKLKLKPKSKKPLSSQWEIVEDNIPMAQDGKKIKNPIYNLSHEDSVKHQADKILKYEQLRGSPTGSPLPYYGEPQYMDMLMKGIYPEVNKILPNASAMEKGEAMDFIFNAGWDKDNNKIIKDPRAYALQEYYKKYDSSKLKDGKWEGRKNAPYSFDKEYDATIGKLPENERRILMNRGRDWYYKNINNPSPGVPNPAYENTWYGRIWNTNDFNEFNPNNSNFIPKKKSGGSIKTDPKGYWNEDNHGKPVRIPSNEITMKGVNQNLLGISDTGDIQMMFPGMDYSFDGKSVTEFPVKAQNGKLIKNPTQENSYYTPSSSDRNIQQNIIKQQEINKIKNRVDFPLYKSNENTKELKTQIGDQSEILKNVVFKDQLPEYVKLIKNHPEQENLWRKETLEKAKNYGNDTSKYLAALQLLKENGSPYITQNSYFEDKYRKNRNEPTSNFRASKNLMYLEPDDREGFIAELSHAQQLKDNFLEDKNVPQKLDSIYKKQKQTNPNIDYHEVYDKYYYNMPNSIEYDAHTLRQPKLQQRYDFLIDSFKNELPFMSFTPQYIVNEKIKLDNAGKDYYKGTIGNFRRVINKGIDNIFGTDIYKAFGNDPKKQKLGGNIKTDPQGYWNKENVGKPVNIPSNRITMKGVNQPLMGISNTGDIQYMQPNGEYLFDGNSVTEFPIMQQGGQVRQPIRGTREQYQAYQDSLDLYNTDRILAERLKNDGYANFTDNQASGDTKSIISRHFGKPSGNKMGMEKVSDNMYRVKDYYADVIEDKYGSQYLSPNVQPQGLRTWGKFVKHEGDLLPSFDYRKTFNYENAKPVQPIIYQPENEIQNLLEQPQVSFPNTTNGQFNRTISKIRPKETPIQIESKKADLLPTSPMNLEIERIPFAKGTYFTRDRQNQELDSKQFGRKVKKDYFDKKTGKLLGTYKNGEKVSDWEIID